MRAQKQQVMARSSSWPDGLMDQDDFEASCRLDETLINLRHQLPNTLKVPLTLSNALLVYDPGFQLVGPKHEVLVSSVDELVSLSSTLVATTWSAQTAQRALMSTFSTSDESLSSSLPIVECELVWDTTKNQDTVLTVTWSTTTVVGEQLVEGVSELILKNGKITTHKLLDVSLDGRTISAIGEAMATLRSAVRSVPFPQNSPLLDAIFEVRDGFLAAAAQSANDPSSSFTENTVSPLFYNNSIHASETVLIDSSNGTAVSEMADYYPLPGSSVWQDYASSHKALFSFWSHDVPLLAGEEFVIHDDMSNFASNATLWGPNSKKSILLMEGGAKIAQAYQTLASLRRASNGKWKIQKARVDWRERTCDIEWLATIPTGIASIEGTDRFTLNAAGSVESIQQMELSVGGNIVLDPEPVRGFLTTLEAYDGVLVATPGAEIMSDLSRRLSNIMAGSSSPRSGSPDKSPLLPPKLGTDAAASVYNLMCTLHEDLSRVHDLVVAPASTFIDEDISLRGYMGEVLAKGSPAYRQSIGLALASLRGAIRTNSVSVDTDPRVTIEFTRRGNLRVSLALHLMVNPLLGTTTVIGGRTSVSPGFPLKMEVISEYRLKNGKIKKHVLLETRINGQLTPADVVSRWIKRILSPSPEESNNMNGGGSMSALLDIVAWARSMGGGAARK